MATDNENITYQLIAITLSYVQSVEHTIKFCTTYVLQGEEPLTCELLESLDKKERKKALGHFLKKVKDRANLHPSLEELISEFLKNRNDFIHNQHKIKNWDLGTEQGLEVAKKFTYQLLMQAHRLNEIFMSLTNNWANKIGLKPPADAELEYMNELDNRYGIYINEFFTAK